jgi:OOP family OmpA-OmpF porin
MKIGKLCAALMLSAVTATTTAAERPANYAAVLGSYVLSDSIRNSDDGAGASLLFGTYMTDSVSIEFNLYGHEFSRNFLPDGDDAFVGGGIDLRYLTGGSRFGGFLIGGLGAVREDYVEDAETSPYANLGLGVLVGITPSLQMRAEARQYATLNSVSFADEDAQYDTRFGLGLQYLFSQDPAPPQDDDGDGVANGLDRCPDTPAGTAVDTQGCPPALPVAMPADSDGDGVVDSVDQCPATPAGVVVDAVGCPADEDGDGVLNANDACPRTPPGFEVDAGGCVVERQTVTVLEDVSFEFNSARLTASARRTLDRVAAGLRGQPDMRVAIGGHTDSIGSDSYNDRLSRERAASVLNFLANLGVKSSRMEANGYGESRPVADNDSDEGRARNRRVEFTVLSQ